MSNRRWLDVAEYVSLSGSVLGLVASAVSQQAAFASAPLSFSVLLNLVRRQKLDRQTEKVLPELDLLNERLSQESQSLQALSRQVLALPTPDDLGNLKTLVLQEDRETKRKLATDLQEIQSRFQNQIELDLAPVQAELSRLQTRSTELEEQVTRCNQSLETLPSSSQVENLEEAIAALQIQTTQIQMHLTGLEAQLDLAPFQNQLDGLSAHLNQTLDQYQQELEQSLSPLRKEIHELRHHLAILIEQLSHKTEPKLIEALRHALLRTVRKITELRQQINQLASLEELATLRVEVKEMLVLYLRDLQQQVSTTQDSLMNLTETVMSLKPPTVEPQGVQLEPDLLPTQQEIPLKQEIVDAIQNSPPHPTDARVGQDVVITQVERVEETAELNGTAQTRSWQRLHELSHSSIPSLSREAQWQATEIQSGTGLDELFEPLDHDRVMQTVLDWVQQRLICTSSWLEQFAPDTYLPRMAELLQRNVQISIGWNSWGNRDITRVYRRINQKEGWTENGLRDLLQQLKHLSQQYPERCSIKSFLNREKLLICDRAIAILMRHSPDPASSEPVGLCTTDSSAIRQWIDGFDQPMLDIQEAAEFWQRAAIRYELGDIYGVIADYNQGLRLEPTHDVAYNNRGVAYYLVGGREKAIADFDQALKLNPNSSDAYFNRATTWSELGDRPQAILDYTAAIRLNPDDYIAYNNRGLVYAKSGHCQEAQQDYTESIRINPDNPIAHNNRALVRSKLGDKQGAIADYTIALQINPQDEAAYFNRGAVQASLGEYAAAIADYTLAIQLNPTFVNAYNNRGFIHQKMGNETAALEDFNQVLQINPNFANAYNNRGTVRSKLKDFEGAIKDFNQALQINPNFANAYNNRGTALCKLKRFEEAVKDFNRALLVNPNFANAYNNRGLARIDLGDRAGAIADLTQAAKLFKAQGNSTTSQQALDKVKKLEHEMELNSKLDSNSQQPTAIPKGVQG